MFPRLQQVVCDGWRPEPRVVHGEHFNYEFISFQHVCTACRTLAKRRKGNGKGRGKGKGKGKGKAKSNTRPEEDEVGEDGEDDAADPDGESG